MTSIKKSVSVSSDVLETVDSFARTQLFLYERALSQSREMNHGPNTEKAVLWAIQMTHQVSQHRDLKDKLHFIYQAAVAYGKATVHAAEQKG